MSTAELIWQKNLNSKTDWAERCRPGKNRRARKTVKRQHMPCGDLGRREQTVTEKSSVWVETQHTHPQSPNVSRQTTTGPLGPPKESPSPFIGRSKERENLKATRESDP